MGNTPTTLASRLQERFNGSVSNLVPNSAVLTKLKFRHDIELGKAAVFDVSLSDELGFSVGQGSVTLNGNIAQTSAKASVDAYSLILQSNVSYDLITRANKKEKAFAQFTDSKFIPMAESFRRREELSLMYGREGLGKVSSNTGGTNETVLLISADTWCPTFWLALKGANIEAWSAKTGGSQHDGIINIKSVDVVARTVTVTAAANAYTNIVANDHLFFTGTHDAGHIGLMSIARNTGTLFSISAALHALWAANSYDVGASSLTLGKILQMGAVSANKGCEEDLKMLVPVKSFQGLVTDEAALRQYGANYNKEKAENGFKRICFAGASGDIEIIPYKYLKEGECIMFPERWTYILGSSEMTSVLAKDGDMMFDIETSSDKQMRLFSDTQIFCERPGYITYGTRSDSLALHT